MKRHGILKLWLVLLVLVGWVVRAGAAEFPVKDLPRTGKTLKEFVPRGWTVETEASGDLNSDGLPDIAAVLIREMPESGERGAEDELGRALLVLLGNEKEGFLPAGSNDDLLLCRGCGGMREHVGIEIVKGVVIVKETGGSRESTSETWRFRYDPRSQRFVLIGRDSDSRDSVVGKGKEVSFNTLTGLKVTQTYRYDKSGEHRTTLSTKKEMVPAKTPFMEDVTR
jgi:hypothetical protein